jgi:hypothetical protein
MHEKRHKILKNQKGNPLVAYAESGQPFRVSCVAHGQTRSLDCGSGEPCV